MIEKNNTRKLSFRKMAYRQSLKLIILPIAVLLVVLFLVYAITIASFQNAENKRKCEELTAKLSLLCERHEDFLCSFSDSDSLRELLLTGSHPEAVNEQLYRFLNSGDYRCTFYVLDAKYALLSSIGDMPAANSTLSAKRVAYHTDVSPSGTVREYSRVMTNPSSADPFYRAYSVGRSIALNGEKLGYLEYRFYERDLLSYLGADGRNLVVITNPNGIIIASNAGAIGDSLSRFQPDLDGHLITLEGSSYYIRSGVLEGSELIVYTLTQRTRVLSDSGTLLLFALLVLFMALFLVESFSRKLSSRVNEPVDQLMSSFESLREGYFSEPAPNTNLVEFDELISEYNAAISKLDEIMNVKQNLEISQLEAQFNPHFLFNILETVRYTIDTDPEVAQKMILKLSRLLRYSVSHHGQRVPLQEDIAFIRDYLSLQKERYLDRLEYSVTVDDAVRDAKVFKLIMQPLIENSVKYGYMARQDLRIDIRCYTENGDLILSVADNGGGMSEERFRQVGSLLADEVNSSQNYGLYNTHRMVRLAFGEPYGLSLSRIPDGLEAVIRMPFQE